MSRKKSKLKTFQKKILRNYFKNLKSKIKLDGVLLFGSYAYGKPNRHSDIDLVVISRSFKNLGFLERLEFLSKMREGVAEKIPMDIIGYTPEEFKNIDKESIIMKQAKKEGKMIYF
ncbi:MAG: nucleotidyltransferase domain-containing protein [Patescibacteria group bacterium]